MPKHDRVVKIPRPERTSPDGMLISAPTLLNILKYRLANPLLSQAAIGDLTGHRQETISRALNTPYARRYLEDMPTDVRDLYANKLHEAQGDTVNYYHASIRRGLTELPKNNPNPAVLVNARGAGDTVSKITGLLQERLTLRDETRSALDYNELHEIPSDIVEALEQGEGEPHTPGSAAVRGDPTADTLASD